jgi:sterol desaturase/sphingolipid hydroxylase (fatty acid hydroxylase superfamily)
MSPTVTLAVMLVAVLAITGVCMRILRALGVSDVVRRHRTRIDRPARIAPAAYRRSAAVNSTLSTGMVFAVSLGFAPRLFAAHPVGVLRVLGEVAAILAVYDLGYYFMHRFAFHGWSVGRRIHAVHHAIRSPYTTDSLYIHPAETVAGVGLFLASTALVALAAGAVSPWAFALAFLVYSVLNLFNHSGIDVPFFPFRWLCALVRHHDVHHESMKSGYYATITPVWDVVFGTARRSALDKERGV